VALNFPDNPTINQVYSDVTAGFYYRWDGTVWQSYSPSSASNIKVLDDISSQFTGIAQTFALTSGGVTVIPINAAQLVINLGGVVQDPSDDYSVNGSNIIFSSAPEIEYSFSGISLGPAIPLTDLPARSIAPDKLTIGAPAWQSNYNVGIGTTLPTSALNVIGNANITGVITATTFDGNATSAYYASIAGYSTNAVNATNATYATNSINVSSGIASVAFLNVSGITTLGVTTATNLTSQQLNVSGVSTVSNLRSTNINATGIVTANTFVGQLNSSGVSTVANLRSTNINATGIVTASIFSGSGVNLTGVVTSIVAGTGITITQSTGIVTVSTSGSGGGVSVGMSFFTSPATFTIGVDCPAQTTRIKITACGGGGNGGNGGTSGGEGGSGGSGGGGGGSSATNVFYRSVTNGDVYTFNVGTGGQATTIRYPGSTVFATCPAGGNGSTGGSNGGAGGAGGAAGTFSPLAVPNFYVGRSGPNDATVGPGAGPGGPGGTGAVNVYFSSIFSPSPTGVTGGAGGAGGGGSTAPPGAGLNSYGGGGGGGGGGGIGYDGSTSYGGGAGGPGQPGAVIIEF
jgi:hypothetical protein